MRHQEIRRILAVAKTNVKIHTLRLKQAKTDRERYFAQHALDHEQDYVTQNEGR